MSTLDRAIEIARNDISLLKDRINNVNLNKKKGYEINLSLKELQKRTHKDYLTTKKMLSADAPEYLNLAEGDKKALKHLVKAAVVLDKVNMQLDNPHNLAFKEYLEKEIAKGNMRNGSCNSIIKGFISSGIEIFCIDDK